MTNFEHIKRFLSLIIFACFFLPLCQCTAKEKAPVLENQSQQIAASKPDVFIPATAIEFKSIDEIPLVLVFVWPLATVLIRLLPRPKTAILRTNVLELLCSLVSIIYIVYIIKFWGSIKFGGIIYISASILYCLVCGYILFTHYRRLLTPTMD